MNGSSPGMPRPRKSSRHGPGGSRIVRNPLYQWTHLELRRVFGVDELLNPETAREIYSHCTALLRKKEFSARSIIRKFRVEASLHH